MDEFIQWLGTAKDHTVKIAAKAHFKLFFKL